MAILRTLTTKIKTKMSPSSSPTTTSPTSPQVSSFERVSGRKDYSVQRPQSQTRMDSFIDDDVYEAPKETEKKERRVSRFREELFE